MLDTVHRIETPEGVDIDLRTAGPAARSLAYLIDLALRGVILACATVLLGIFGALGFGLFLILTFALEWLYPVLFEVLWRGSTPGKRLLRLEVVHQDGTPVGWAASLVRNLLRAADFLPLAYGFGLASAMSTRGFRRLGDLAAGTLVIYADEAASTRRLPEVPPVRPPVALELDEQRAVIAFAQRLPRISAARARELAAVAEPLWHAGAETPDDPARALAGMAAFLAGRRTKT